MSALAFASQNFTVPAGAGSYAPERIQLNSQNASVKSELVERVTAVVEAVVATAVAELWLLKPGADPTNDANYALYSSIANAAALGGATVELADAPGAQIRVKSGGTAGTVTISASAKIPVRSLRR